MDTQAQLLELETELMHIQNKKGHEKQKRNYKDAQLYAPKCPCMDATTGAEDISYASEDVIKTLKQLDHDKDELVVCNIKITVLYINIFYVLVLEKNVKTFEEND